MSKADRVKPNGERIKQLLAEKRLYLSTFKEKVRLHPRTVDKVLAGNMVEIATLEIIARSLGEPYESLVMRSTVAVGSSEGSERHTPQPSANGNAIVPYRHATAPDVRPSDDCMELTFRYSTISLSIRDDAATPRTMKRLFSLVEEAMIEYDDYKSRVEELEKEGIMICLVKGFDFSNRPMFAYIAFLTSRYAAVMECIHGQCSPSDVSLVIESGRGEPSPKLKAKMKKHYLFDQDAAERLYHCDDPSPGLA